MEIYKIIYNWSYTSGDDQGETYDVADIESSGCISISEHRAQGEGDKWYYDIHYNTGNIVRTFNPNKVYYKPEATCDNSK